MIEKTKARLGAVFISAAAMAMPVASLFIVPCSGVSNHSKKLDAMSADQAATFIEHTADKIAADIEAQDPKAAQTIRHYFRTANGN